MLRVKMLTGNETCIFDDGKTYIFNRAGNCYIEDGGLLPKYTSGMLSLPIISILSSSGKVEIALFENDNMRKFSTNFDSSKCLMGICSKGGHIKMLTRSGKHEDILFNQMILVYPEGTSLSDKISGIEVMEVF